MSAEASINLEAITGILGAVEKFFADSGCPLTAEQRAALDAGPRAHAEKYSEAAS